MRRFHGHVAIATKLRAHVVGGNKEHVEPRRIAEGRCSHERHADQEKLDRFHAGPRFSERSREGNQLGSMRNGAAVRKVHVTVDPVRTPSYTTVTNLAL